MFCDKLSLPQKAWPWIIIITSLILSACRVNPHTFDTQTNKTKHTKKQQLFEEPNAMAIATVDAAGTGGAPSPSCRMVLLKGYDERGFTFYTNYSSRKGERVMESGREGEGF